VRGNITASRLRIADGVSFEGSVEMIRSGGDVDLFATRADTLKNQIRIDQNA
jgi:cytoskeletal protein CcmA (bactofilin family)